MTHTFTSYHTPRDELAVFVDSSLAGAHTFELGVVRIDVFDWTKDTLTEQTVTLRLLGTIVDRLRFCHFTVAPFEDILSACDGKAHCIEVGDVIAYQGTCHHATPFVVVIFNLQFTVFIGCICSADKRVKIENCELIVNCTL